MGDRPENASRLSLERASRILARLAHRFADREAILWRAGLDESRWSAMEQQLLSDLDLRTASDTDLARFARIYLEARSELLHGASAPPSIAATTRRPSSSPLSDEAVPTLPRGAPSADLHDRFRSTANLGTPNVLGSNPSIAEMPSRRNVLDLEDPSTDEDALSATLHSDGPARRAPPRSR